MSVGPVLRTLLGAAPFLLIVACGGRPAKPVTALPEPRTGTFLPAIRAQIDAAYGRAVAARTDKEAAEAAGRYGMVLEAYEMYDLARHCYERAHALDPGVFRWTYHLAVLQEAANDRAAAIATMGEALALTPDYLPARLSLASMLLAAGDAERSRERAASAVADVPGSARAHYTLGRALHALGRSGEAASSLEEAARLAPAYSAAHYALALAYRDLGRPADAAREMALYEKNRDGAPPDDDPLVAEVEQLDAGSLASVHRAEEHMAGGRLAEAAAEYEHALALEGGDKWIHTALVSVYSRMAAWDKAEAHYRAALAADPAFSKAHYNYALMKAERSEYGAAVVAFHKALAADPADAAVHGQLARVHELLREPALAEKHYRLAVRYDPSATAIRGLLIDRLLGNGKGREALDEMMVLLVSPDVNRDAVRAALHGAYPKIGTPAQVGGYLRDARQRAAAEGRGELVAAIDGEIGSLRGLHR